MQVGRLSVATSANGIGVKAVSKGKFWTLSIYGPSSSPHHAVRQAVPGITPSDYYWLPEKDGVMIAFAKLKDARTFLKNGGAMLIALGYGQS